MALYGYPAAADAQTALGVVWKKVSGGTVDTKDFVQAGWVLEGYALSIGVPKMAPAKVDNPEQDLKNYLTPHVQPHVLGDGTFAKGILDGLSTLPWSTILPILLQLIQGVK